MAGRPATIPGRRIATALWLVTAAGAVAIVVGASSGSAALGGGPLVVAVAMFGVVALLFSSTGTVIEASRPGNRVGWLMIACGPVLVATFGGFLVGAIRGAVHGQDDLIGGLVAWVGTMGIAPAVYLVGPLLATVFPDGRLPGPRWRVIVLLTSALVAATDVTAAFLPGPLQSGLPDNPLGIVPAAVTPVLRAASDVLLTVGFLAGMLMATAAVVTRFRRSIGQEREQMKWFLVAVIAVAVTTPLSTFDGSTTTSLFDFALILSIAFVPISIGVAVTRYHLYDIDTIINRALVYGLLTAILAGGSAAAIGVVQRVFQGALGSGSDATIVVTTLVVVAAFDPLKKRLQALVDRRFKETRDPVALVTLLVEELERSPWQIDRRRTATALLRTVVDATAAQAARVVLKRDGTEDVAVRLGEEPFEGSWSLRASSGQVAIEIELGFRGGGSAADPEALRPAVERAAARLA